LELRHLRYFVAVAERGSVLAAAQELLNTSQPSLSRQIRDLEAQVGARLLERQSRGVTLTAAGKIFLDHARLALAQVDAAIEGARRAALAEVSELTIGILAGHEAWFARAQRILREEAPGVEVRVTSQSSPDLALALMRGQLDVAFLRREEHTVGLCFTRLAEEPLVVMMPVDHRLASCEAIDPQELAKEIYVGSATASPVVDAIVRNYAAKMGIRLDPKFDAGSLSAVLSVVVATGGITMVPAYTSHLLTPNGTTRPLKGPAPTIELALAYREANASPLLQRLLARAGELVE
jgi:LysR family hca operon transcriptional activator